MFILFLLLVRKSLHLYLYPPFFKNLLQNNNYFINWRRQMIYRIGFASFPKIEFCYLTLEQFHVKPFYQNWWKDK